MTTEVFTQEDLEKIKGSIKPKNVKAICVISLGLLALSFLLPFMPGKHSRLSPYQDDTYWHAFTFYLIVFAAMTMLFYYRYIMSINQDLRDGEKIVARLPVIIKNTWIPGNQFNLIFDKSRLLHTPKITLPKTEIGNWREGDLVDLELLYKSGEILNYKKAEK